MRGDDMKNRYLPAQFNERIEGFAPEIIGLGLAILFIIFTLWPWWVNGLVVLGTWSLLTFGGCFLFPGQSFGKRAAKTRVVDHRYQPISWRRMILRETLKWTFIVVSFGLYIPLALAQFSQQLNRQTWHDKLFKTYVVFQYPKVN